MTRVSHAKKKISFGILLSGVLLLTACRSAPLLNQRVILRNIGIDATEPGFSVTANAFIAARNDGEGDVVQISGEGQTVTDAVEAMALTTGGQPYFSHNRAVVIGKTLAEQGIGGMMQFFSSYYECRGTAVLYVAEGKAAEMIEQAEQDPGLAAGLDDLARIGAENGSSVETAVWETSKNLCDPDVDFCLPRLVSDGESVWVDGSVVFRGDRMVGTLSEAETKGLLILRGEPEFCSVTWKSEALGAVTVVISQIQSKLNLDCSGETPRFTVSVKCVGTLGERTNAEKADSTFLVLAEEECAAEITHWIRLAIRTALRQNGADPFGFGRTLRQKEPQIWAEMDEEWHTFLQKCRYQAEVSVRCR